MTEPLTLPAPTGPVCGPREPDGPVFVTADGVDPELDRPYLDLDEPRSFVDPVTGDATTYRYVHGGFHGTGSRFALHFPEPEQYAGRCFHPTYPMFDDEDAWASWIPFAISHGAILVAANNDGGLPAAATLGGYRTNAAAAKVARALAAQVYGTGAAVRSYLFGASGGAYQTIGALENTEGVWEGGVPMVPGAANAIPSYMSAQLLGLRVLRDALPGVVDALEPGGSGDPYAGLDDQQRAVLEEVTRLGFPPRGWWQHAVLDGGAFRVVVGGVRALDPTYVDDFWTAPGYGGVEPEVAAARVVHATVVVAVTPAGVVELAEVPLGDYLGADLVVTGGAAAGETISVAAVTGTDVTPGDAEGAVRALRPGDPVRLDNSCNVALQYYPRHQVPAPDQYGWDQYRGPDGRPVPAQRALLTGEIFARATCGSLPVGAFHGRMIMLASVLDVQAFPWSADWYAQRARHALGASAHEDRFRLWFLDNADHDEPPDRRAEAYVVGYRGELEQALLDLDRWVADGVAPPHSTRYRIDAETQVQLPAGATERGGVQPVVSLEVGAEGGDRADVAVGESVGFVMTAELPPDTGRIVHVEWDFEGQGDFAAAGPVEPATEVVVSAAHEYAAPGTRFAVVRVTAQRDGDVSTPFTRIQNLARVRVVVQ